MQSGPVQVRRSKTVGAVPLLRALGLFEPAANGPALDDRALERFATRQLAFDWIHMGNSEIPVGQAMAAIQDCPPLSPPRTGHIGNWDNIVHGRAGPRDYNNLTCGRLGLGYPLLFDLNQTESNTPGIGDWSYLPGSIVKRCDRTPLALVSWDGTRFRHRDRKHPLFTPFVLADIDGELVPLTVLHRHACQASESFQFRYQSTLLLQHEKLVRDILHVLLSHASGQDEPTAVLRRLFDRRVRLDGRIDRCALALSGRGFRMAEITYTSTTNLIDHALLPLRAAARPATFAQCVKDLPGSLPLMSAVLLVLILASLNTHYPDLVVPVPEWTRPCNPHLHWGGIPMAGYPPRERGYFADNTRHLRKLFRPLVHQLPAVDPVFFVLLPAGIFNLCPNDAFPEDIESVSALMDDVHGKCAHLTGHPAELRRAIEGTVLEWWSSHKTRLSGYFCSRFDARRGVVSSIPAPVDGELVVLPGFARLTVQQASMITGVLSELPWADTTLAS